MPILILAFCAAPLHAALGTEMARRLPSAARWTLATVALLAWGVAALDGARGILRQDCRRLYHLGDRSRKDRGPFTPRRGGDRCGSRF